MCPLLKQRTLFNVYFFIFAHYRYCDFFFLNVGNQQGGRHSVYAAGRTGVLKIPAVLRDRPEKRTLIRKISTGSEEESGAVGSRPDDLRGTEHDRTCRFQDTYAYAEFNPVPKGSGRIFFKYI